MQENDTRPDPEVLLARLKEEEQEEGGRGKLRIYLGYAAGVGKTYTMLQAAHEAADSGEDVAAGYIEPHVRRDTQKMAEKLEKEGFSDTAAEIREGVENFHKANAHLKKALEALNK